VGKYTYMGNGTVASNAEVGNYCAIARNVEIGSKSHPTDLLSIHPFQYEQSHFTGQPGYETGSADWETVSPSRRVTIGHDVWIGHKVCIQGGVTIGTGAIIGTGAVVTRDVPPYAVVAGVPARVIRYRFEDDVVSELLRSEWWLLEPSDLAGVDFARVQAAVSEINAMRAGFLGAVRRSLASWMTCRERGSLDGSPAEGSILRCDVEKSYACPGAIGDYSEVDVDLYGCGDVRRAGISRAQFDAVHNAYVVEVFGLGGPVVAGLTRFRLV